MPSYLQRVAASGARTTSAALPPVTAAPSVPIVSPRLSGAAASIDAESPAELDLAAWQPDEIVPEAASGEAAARVGDAASLMRRARALAGRGDAVVIRAPRGLRPADAMLVPTLDPLGSSETPPSAQGSKAPEGDRSDGAPAGPAPLVASAREGTPDASSSVGRTRATPPVLTTAGAVATDGASAATSARATAGAIPGAVTDPTGTDEALDRRAPMLAPSAPPRAALVTAQRTSSAPVASRDAPSRITIGRVEVEVHNEAPASPPDRPVRAEPLGSGSRLTTRFLLRP
jgi:hypothetical protein